MTQRFYDLSIAKPGEAPYLLRPDQSNVATDIGGPATGLTNERVYHYEKTTSSPKPLVVFS